MRYSGGYVKNHGYDDYVGSSRVPCARSRTSLPRKTSVENIMTTNPELLWFHLSCLCKNNLRGFSVNGFRLNWRRLEVVEDNCWTAGGLLIGVEVKQWWWIRVWGGRGGGVEADGDGRLAAAGGGVEADLWIAGAVSVADAGSVAHLAAAPALQSAAGF